MASQAGKSRETVGQLLIYRLAYEDGWGVFHDPRTEWDHLLKYYKSWVRLIQIGEGSRRMCRPASTGAQAIIHREKQQHRDNISKLEALEAEDLGRVSRNKEWKRRRRRKIAKERNTKELSEQACLMGV